MPVKFKDISEPVNVIIGNHGGLVVFNVVGETSGEVYWHLKFQPGHSRDLAAALTMNSIKAEEENIGGGS
jgi:hypothetical protein